MEHCRFSYAGTWELVNLFVGTKKISYHICYESIGGKHNKKLLSQETETDHGQTEMSNMLVKNKVLNEINKEGTLTQSFKDCRKIKRKVSQNLDDLQNLLIRLTVKASSEKA